MFCSTCGIKFKLEKDGSEICDECLQKGKHPETENIPEKKGFFGKLSIKNIGIGIVVIGFILYKAFVFSNNSAIDEINPLLEKYNNGEISEETIIPALEKALSQHMTNENKLIMMKSLADAYYTNGDYQKSNEVSKEQLPLLEKDSFEYFVTKGDIFMLEENIFEAKKAYTQAYTKKPNDFSINNSLCVFHIEIDSSPESIKYCKKSYELNSGGLIKANLAIAYIDNNQNDKGIALLESIDMQQNPYVAYWIGIGYFQNEDEINAKKHFQIASDNGFDIGEDIQEYLSEE